MKILVVMNYRPRGHSGIVGAIDELVKNLKEEGFSVDILSTYGKIRERIRSILNIFRITSSYDIIIPVGCADYGFLPILVGFVAGKIYCKRTLVNFHEGCPAPFMDRFGKLFKFISGNTPIIVASGYLSNLFKKYKFNVFTIAYHFNYQDFPNRQKPFIWNKRFLWVGTFQYMYDPQTALKACVSVLHERADAEYYFFGEGPLLKSLKEKYIHPNIKFLGFLPRADLLKEYQNFPVLINTSFGDNFPLRIIEASFNQLLVISAKYGGTPTIYNNDECLFFEKGDDKALAKLILGILENPDTYNQLRINMHKKIMSFTWGNVRNKWLELLNG